MVMIAHYANKCMVMIHQLLMYGAGPQGSTTISLVPLLLLVLFCVYLHKRGLGPTNITR